MDSTCTSLALGLQQHVRTATQCDETEYKICSTCSSLRTQYKIQNTEYKIQNTEYRIQYARATQCNEREYKICSTTAPWLKCSGQIDSGQSTEILTRWKNQRALQNPDSDYIALRDKHTLTQTQTQGQTHTHIERNTEGSIVLQNINSPLRTWV